MNEWTESHCDRCGERFRVCRPAIWRPDKPCPECGEAMGYHPEEHSGAGCIRAGWACIGCGHEELDPARELQMTEAE